MNKMINATLLASFLFTHSALAQDENVIPVKVHKDPTIAAAADQPNTIYLLRMHLSTDEKNNMIQARNQPSIKAFAATPSDLPASVLVSMNGVPVLYQGMHGSCVTFAVTAALDAILNQGDYVSQLCNLELSDYLSQNGYLTDGWNGAYGSQIINQILSFGIISKTNQYTQSCEQVREYPFLDEKDQGNPMSLESFKKMSENISTTITMTTLLSIPDAFDMNNAEADILVTKIKKELHEEDRRTAHNRIVFGTFMPDSDGCNVGACATHNKKLDTWVLSDNIKNNPSNWFEGGHEMVIIGYDDNAVATDIAGIQHKGLFTLRNSWSKFLGDNGNYYMSYDYFKNFAWEVYVLKSKR